MPKKNYILDTSVCLTDANCIFNYGNNDIILPLKVLEEIDKHKKRQEDTDRTTKHNARQRNATQERTEIHPATHQNLHPQTMGDKPPPGEGIFTRNDGKTYKTLESHSGKLLFPSLVI